MSGPLGNCDPGVEAIEESSDTRLVIKQIPRLEKLLQSLDVSILTRPLQSDRNGVKEKHQVIGSLHYEMESVVAQLAQKDRELKASQQEACQLTKFLHNCEEELHKRVCS